MVAATNPQAYTETSQRLTEQVYGLVLGDIREIILFMLASMGYDRHRSTVIEFMKKMARDRQALVYRSANSSKSTTKHSRLIWDDSKLEV